MCVRRQTFDSSSDATPCARRSSFGLSRLAVLCCLSHTLFASSIAPAALLDSAWHRLLLHREPGAVVVVLSSTHITITLYAHTTRGVATAHSKQKQAAYTHRHSPTRRQEGILQCVSDPGLSRTTAHVLCLSGSKYPPSCWLARQTKKETHDHTRPIEERHSPLDFYLYARRHLS